MKKFLSIFLAILMLVTMAVAAIPVSAADGVFDDDASASAAGYYFRVAEEGTGTQYYNHLKFAIAAAAEDGTVYVISNCSLTGRVAIQKDLTIKGADENVTISYSGNTKTATYTQIYETGMHIQIQGTAQKAVNVTIEDITIQSTDANGQGIVAVYGNSNLTIKNSTIASPKQAPLRIGGENNNVTVDESIIERPSTGSGSAIYAIASEASTNLGMQMDIDVINGSVIRNASTQASWGINNSVVGLNGALTAASSLSVDETSTLEYAAVNGATGNDLTSSIFCTAGGTFNVELAKGAKLKATSVGTHITKFQYLRANAGTINLTDNGAVYEASANVLKLTNGFVLPTAAEGETRIGWKKSNGAIYNDLSKISKDATMYTLVRYNANDLTNKEGAAIRLASDTTGIRYTVNVNDDLYKLVTENGGSFGMAIALSEKLTDKTFADLYAESSSDVIYTGASIWATEGKEYRIAAWNIPEEDYTTAISATAYFKINVDGVDTYYFAADNDNSRSLYDLAKAYYEDTEKGSINNATVNEILTAGGYFAG